MKNALTTIKRKLAGRTEWCILTALVLLACLLLVRSVTNDPMREIADIEQLIAKFEETSFSSDENNHWNEFFRRKGPLRIYPDPGFPSFLRKPLFEYARELNTLTSVQIVVVEDPLTANTRIIHVPSGEFKNFEWRSWDPHFLVTPPRTGEIRCFFASSAPVVRFLIGIGSEYSEQHRQSCLLEELYQGLGPGKNTSIIRPSISSNEDLLTELSINDKILLRTYHDPALKPGMHRAEVMSHARKIIHELVEAVEREGERALIHPRWRTRQTQQNVN